MAIVATVSKNADGKIIVDPDPLPVPPGDQSLIWRRQPGETFKFVDIEIEAPPGIFDKQICLENLIVVLDHNNDAVGSYNYRFEIQHATGKDTDIVNTFVIENDPG